METVHPSINVQESLVDNFLSKYGEVLSTKAVVDQRGIETFEYVFMMYEEDLQNHPPPNYLWMGKTKLRVKYKGQPPACFICDEPDHVANQCPKKKKRLDGDDNTPYVPPDYDRHFPKLITDEDKSEPEDDKEESEVEH